MGARNISRPAEIIIWLIFHLDLFNWTWRREEENCCRRIEREGKHLIAKVGREDQDEEGSTNSQESSRQIAKVRKVYAHRRRPGTDYYTNSRRTTYVWIHTKRYERTRGPQKMPSAYFFAMRGHLSAVAQYVGRSL